MDDRRQLKQINITGVVQGVGFRPFVYQLAHRLGLTGWVCNTSAGVDIEVEGLLSLLDDFVVALETEAPPLARIDRVTVTDGPRNGYTTFEIRHSVAQEGLFQPISPDICTCDDCLRELLDPNDRRYHYPFTNCTNCGPRFTIIQDIPYDRPNTTMRPFVMCADCQAEYDDPLDRRFHAQPNACPVCGPRAWLERAQGLIAGAGLQTSGVYWPVPLGGTRGNSRELGGNWGSSEAIELARCLLAEGAIVAVKGLGGFHLACDAANDEAVQRLRERKGRVDKPFAIMSYDLATVEQYCIVDEEERRLLESRERPIVLLRERLDSSISKWVAPGNRYLGVMLPYTPLHYLLLEGGTSPPGTRPPRFPSKRADVGAQDLTGVLTGSNSPPKPRRSGWLQKRFLALVMTSGNYSEEPIATDNEEALDRLASLADAFLLHDRDIHARCDDSVVRVFEGHELPIRRSRGYAPYPVHLPFPVGQILACGAELKNTFCLTRDDYAFMSQHIGDMENYETLVSYEAVIEHFKDLFRVQPEIIAHDMHPDYLATRYAQQQRLGIRDWRFNTQSPISMGVQHHHAHIAACMAEHGLTGPVIGVSLDGTGFGTDGHIWGGEFLVCDYAAFHRAAHLAYVPLPGGDVAVKKPYRMALSHLYHAFGTLDLDLPPTRHPDSVELGVIERQIRTGLNAPLTSSMGRLFDAVASVIGLRQEVNYEAQAAIELEMVADEEIVECYDVAVAEMFRGIQGTRPNSFGTGTGAVSRGAARAPALVLDPAPLVRAIVADVRGRVAESIIAARFHNSLAELICDVCLLLRDREGLNRVALSGGVFQNFYLLKQSLDRLRTADFEVYTHRLVPPNDGGIALGQAVIAHFIAQG